MSWKPSEEIIKRSNIQKMMLQHHFSDYHNFWQWSVTHKKEFWSETIDNLGIKLSKPFTSVFDSTDVENPQWLKGSKFNIVDSCFQNDDEATAVIYQDENGQLQKISQQNLERLVNRIANSLYNAGLVKGDVIAIDMPMTLKAVAIYLAAIKAGIPVATVADSFTPNEIAVRLKITQPKLIFTQDYLLRAGKTLPLYSKVVEANTPKAVVIKATMQSINLRKNDIFWDDFLSDNTTFKSVIQNPDDVITILFSSGTTGEPKAIPWTHTTPIKGVSDGYYHHNIQKNDVVCWPTNLGWMMGPWLIFAALINNASIALYYEAPIDRNFGEFVQNAKVTMLGLVPSIVKHWINTKCNENLDWNAIKCFSSTGEASNSKEMEYLMQLANNKPIIEYCGGTEIGGGYVTSTMVQENIPSTFSTQALGGEFVLLDDENNVADKGEIFLIPPIMGLSEKLLNRNHHEVYFKDAPTYKGQKLRRHGDQLVKLENGYYKAMGRVDDAMNLGGIKVSSVQIEAVVNRLDFIKESAAIAVSPEDGGPSTLVIYYVENGINESDEKNGTYLNVVNKLIKTELNPLFRAKELKKIDKLPRTASRKVMRRKLRDLYLGND
ncbi:AMP-binding protein [Aureibaculum sp. 2210JD6-5]|uniref:AMP-binding protein n=1 Tax=Aureibaculum sp. 2210JD6-5 TaxID=3103957 RepID=UPI002AADECA0|nr:AMP-binding protein [Aureibaculum sp. 2210JD6-5]MDY7396547.1 AMP-binding protein [Aureibaculum sp. 2210JD6-5]